MVSDPLGGGRMTPAEILARLAEIAQQVEAHKAAAWLLEREADELRTALRRLNWTPPATGAAT